MIVYNPDVTPPTNTAYQETILRNPTGIEQTQNKGEIIELYKPPNLDLEIVTMWLKKFSNENLSHIKDFVEYWAFSPGRSFRYQKPAERKPIVKEVDTEDEASALYTTEITEVRDYSPELPQAIILIHEDKSKTIICHQYPEGVYLPVILIQKISPNGSSNNEFVTITTTDSDSQEIQKVKLQLQNTATQLLKACMAKISGKPK